MKENKGHKWPDPLKTAIPIPAKVNKSYNAR